MDSLTRKRKIGRVRPGWLVPLVYLLTGAACMLVASSALAQPSLQELRNRLEAARTSQDQLPEGAFRSIAFNIDVAQRIERNFSEHAGRWRRRAGRFLDRAEAGVDPFPEQHDAIVNRGYPSRLSDTSQGYAIYLPPDYDPNRSYPLVLCLHGGSSNGNLFLGVVMGNNMSWLSYNQYLWNDFRPQTHPDVIMVSPDGYGQVMWRWMGEQDVLDVMADVKRHYNIDENRVVLMGLSNGGVGAYSVGSRHAYRFSMVQAVAGAPSWLLYAGGRQLPEERRLMRPLSVAHTPRNITNTDFRFYHGRHDGGPMNPTFVERFESTLEDEGIETRATWYDAGHDILYRVHRHGLLFDALGEVVRDPHPARVRIQSGDYRANRQHWLTLTRIEDYPTIRSADARVDDGALDITTDGVRALSVDLRDLPGSGDSLRIAIDGTEVYDGPRALLGQVVHAQRGESTPWALGFPQESGLTKRPGLSGPMTDAYFDSIVHVWGTGNAENTPHLRQAAERGARGYPLWLWRFTQTSMPDTDVTDEIMRDNHVMLYGTASDNSVLTRMQDQLPIRIEDEAVVVGERRFEGSGVGVRFVYPNPLSPNRYVIVSGGVSTRAVGAGHNLPDFMPDYIVFDAREWSRRERLVTGRSEPLHLGFFDDHWELSDQGSGEGGDPDAGVDAGTSPAVDAGAEAQAEAEAEEEPTLPVPPAPRRPRRPTTFSAPASDPAGSVARQIASLVPSFYNFRAEIPGATWRVDRDNTWQIRPEAECHQELADAGVVFRGLPAHPTPAPSPIELLGPIDGVWFRMTHDDRPLTISCELATRLIPLVEILKRHGVRGVDVMSAYRDRPRPSFHTMGLGLDIARLWTDRGWVSVIGGFRETTMHPTCQAPRPRRANPRMLLAIACEVYRARIFSSVLTPNYNEGHRDHFHLDARPNDPRFFLR